jgi:uncharacterized protein YcfJ
MKYILTIVALALSLVATNVSATHTPTTSATITSTSVTANSTASLKSLYGTVIESSPIIETVIQEVPTRSCYIKTVPVYGKTQGTAGDAIAGAIIGGVIGNQVGKGDGNDAATIIGAIIGAKVGENGKKEIIGYREVEVCEIQQTRGAVEIITGFNTTVRVYGENNEILIDSQSFETRMKYAVGESVRLTLTLTLQ